jgi:hypothetical protein
MSTELLPLEESSSALPARRSDALAPDLAVLVERVLTDPNADVSKLSALLDVNERILNRNAKSAFDEAFSRMWPELPEVDERGVIKQKDGSIKSRYAKYEDIQSAVRPVLKQFGFALRHRTEFPAERPGIIRIVGILSGHGHSEESVFEAPPDKNDYRTAIQDQGSTISYGKRYTTEDLLNIITRGVDNDGQGGKPQTPEGFEDWWDAMVAVSDNGLPELEEAFRQTKRREFKEFAINQRRDQWADLKKRAAAKTPKGAE